MENSKEFVNNLDVIYAKPKVEILEILSKMDKNKLALLRIMLYIKLVDHYPEYEKYELPILSNLESRIDDIYEIGYCVQNGIDADRLQNILFLNETESEESFIHQRKGKICFDTCIYKGKRGGQKEEDTVQCIFCQHWTHQTCIGERHKDIVGPWACPSCRKAPDLVHLMYRTLEKMRDGDTDFRAQVTSQIADLKKMLHVKDKLITELATTVEAQSKELSSASKEINNLRMVVADINNQLSANTEMIQTTLVVGSCLIRDISESQLDNTELTCVSGGRIADAGREISQIPESKYEHIVLVIGGNDCDPHDPLEATEASSRYSGPVQVAGAKVQAESRNCNRFKYMSKNV